MASSPAELNAKTEDDLVALVTAVLQGLNEGKNFPSVTPVAPFVTSGVLLRLHNIVQDMRRGGDKCGGWSKHATLGMVVASFTGVRLRISDAEYIGNAQDNFLLWYIKDLKKARISDRQDAFKARKKGVAPPQPSRADALSQRVYQCRFGGVPRDPVLASSSSTSMPVHKQAVPARRVEDVAELNVQLQQELTALKQEEIRNERDRQHTMNALCAAVDSARHAQKAAEALAAEAVRERDAGAGEAQARLQGLKARLSEADKARLRMEGQLARLGAQVAAAHVEVARAKDHEGKLRVEARQAATKLAQGQVEASEAAAALVTTLKQRVKEAEKESRTAAGQVARLGSQVAAAHVEAARAKEQADEVRAEARQAAADAVALRIEAVADVTQQLRNAQVELRAQRKEGQQVAGKLERLGCQLGAALVEAARAQESVKDAHMSVAALQERLSEQEAEAEEKLERLRTLEAAMAKRAREAIRRAGLADTFKAELDATRARLREVRKELNSTRVKLNLETSDDLMEELYSSDSEEEMQSVAASSEDEDSPDNETPHPKYPLISCAHYTTMPVSTCGAGTTQEERRGPA
mmetsp:Transcript_10045/g.24237  ORF Transcript_10045/g.24237 Transcript_10045/m.24237 type:complete len:582 (-) Transcript_10045:1049-2794(-)